MFNQFQRRLCGYDWREKKETEKQRIYGDLNLDLVIGLFLPPLAKKSSLESFERDTERGERRGGRK